MSRSRGSGDDAPRQPDLRFPVPGPAPRHEVPASPEAIRQVLEISEACLPLATSRPDFEAQRLATKVKVPFRIRD
jgi:hypothetical protein